MGYLPTKLALNVAAMIIAFYACILLANAILGDLLGPIPANAQEDFFDLGGDSLTATQLVARVQEVFRIPMKVQDKIFQPFFTTKPTGQGTGLGLSLSYDIVTAHGGELSVETKENTGTEFKIILPI